VSLERQSLCIACGQEWAPGGQLRCEDCQNQWERSQAAMIKPATDRQTAAASFDPRRRIATKYLHAQQHSLRQISESDLFT
jgi:hypothetical protein